MCITIGSQPQMLHTVGSVSIDDLVTILRHRASERGGTSTVPTTILDANWLARKCSQRKKGGSKAKRILARQYNVKIIADGDDKHHHSKKATIDRVAKREQAKLDALVAIRRKLLDFVEQTRSQGATRDELTKLKKTILTLEKKVKTKENLVSTYTFPPNWKQFVCNGDVEKVTSTVVKLIWFEE
jgi:hypothetical protein